MERVLLVPLAEIRLNSGKDNAYQHVLTARTKTPAIASPANRPVKPASLQSPANSVCLLSTKLPATISVSLPTNVLKVPFLTIALGLVSSASIHVLHAAVQAATSALSAISRKDSEEVLAMLDNAI